MIKKLAIGLVGLILVVTIGGYLLFANLDSIVKHTVEKYGSAATLADVRLDSVKLALTDGEAKLSGLSVGNPKGFTTPKAFYLGDIDVKLDTNSIKGDGPIVINSIVIEKPEVTYELLNDGGSNVERIKSNAQNYANAMAGASDAAPESKAAAEKTNGPGRKLMIKSLIVRDGRVSISQQMLEGKELSAGLPEIQLNNIGRHGGATAAQVAEQLIEAISNAAAQASVQELAKEKLNGLIKEVPTSAIGGAAVDTVGSKLKGLMGN